MHQITPSIVADALASQAENVLRELLPGGKLKAGEWCCGSLSGDEGDSLKVRATGNKIGVWSDFATGQTGGDLLDLWAAVRNVSLGDAMREAAAFAGVHATLAPFVNKKREYKLPTKPEHARSLAKADKTRDWLTISRRIHADTLAAYRVFSQGDDTVVFPYYRDGKAIHLKFRSISEKKFWSSAETEKCLFGWQAIDSKARTVVITEGECFPGDTQVMTQSGWSDLRDVTETDRVMQYTESGNLEFAQPSAIIRKAGAFAAVAYRDGRNLSIVSTAGHQHLAIGKGGIRKFKASSGPINHTDLLPRSGIYNGPGICLSIDQIRFCVAVSADCKIDVRKNGSRYAHFAFKKTRKIDRMKDILARLGIGFTSYVDEGRGYTTFNITLPDWCPGRLFPHAWLALMSAAQAEALISELALWDGNFVPNRNQTEYSSKYIANAIFVQSLSHMSGRVSSIINRSNAHGKWFKVSMLHGKRHSSWQGKLPAMEPPINNAYCVTVPSGMLLLKQQNCIFVSGNCDAMSMAQYGYPALSVPYGGGKAGKQDWIDSEYDNLLRFDTIYLCLDSDEAGMEALAEIVDRLGRHRCRVVTLPHKDANDCLKAGVPKDIIDKAMREAKTLDPRELRNAHEYRDAVVRRFYPPKTETKGFLFPWDRIADKFVAEWGATTVIAGYTGHGKSQIVGQLTLDAMRQGVKACVASLEFKPDKWLARMYRQAGVTPTPTLGHIDLIDEWASPRLWVFDVPGRGAGTAKIDRILDVFEYARSRYGIRLFVIDNFTKLGIGEDDYNGQKAAISAITEFTVEHDVHVILVAHMRKSEDDHSSAGKLGIRGSGTITDLVDNVWVMWRDRKKEAMLKTINVQLQFVKTLEAEERKNLEASRTELLQRSDAIFACEKYRNGDAEPRLRIWFDHASTQFIEKEDQPPRRYV